MKFKNGQIYYAETIDVLFLVVDVDKIFNRAKLEHEEFYLSEWFHDLVYIGDL